jgi:hypothetical protein
MLQKLKVGGPRTATVVLAEFNKLPLLVKNEYVPVGNATEHGFKVSEGPAKHISGRCVPQDEIAPFLDRMIPHTIVAFNSTLANFLQ